MLSSNPNSSTSSAVVGITGADGRLGRHLVDGYRRNGWQVVAFTHGANVDGTHQITVDVTDEVSVKQAFAKANDAFGPMDVFIHTVGGWGRAPFLDTSLEDWRSMMRLNLTSTFLCFREATRYMTGKGGDAMDEVRRGRRRLVAISSRQGAITGVAQQAAYSAAKAGVVRLVEAVAAEFAPGGPTAHALAPSTILFDDDADAARSSGEGVPVADLVDTCLFLSSPAGASFNGATLTAFGRGT